MVLWWYLMGGALVAAFLLMLYLTRRRPAVPRPEWARFFSPRQWQRFVDAVLMDMRSRKAIVRYRADGVILAQLGTEQQEAQFSLTNLAQRCRHASETKWSEVIMNHFDQVIRNIGNQAEEHEALQDFAQLCEQLAVRLIASGTLPFDGMAAVRNDIPELVSYLALDLPSTVRSVAHTDVEHWGKTPGELYQIGLENILTRHTNFRVETTEPEPGVALIIAMGDDYFVSSHALLLARHPEWVGRYGTLFIVPTRHVLIMHPINDTAFVKAVQLLGIAATKIERDGPGSITRNLYWYHEGHYVKIPYEITGKSFSVTPPEAFATMMSRVTEDTGQTTNARR